MKFLRRILGITVMIAGILGLILSVAGIISVWMLKPSVTRTIGSTVDTLNTSIAISIGAMDIAANTLDSAVTSVDALSEMLGNTAKTVGDTLPVIKGLNTVIGETLPSTLETANKSLITAQQAASVLDAAIVSLDNFRMVLSATPFLGSLVQPSEPYQPEAPLADSLGELAGTLKDLPDTFSQMADDFDKADNNLGTVQGNLETMSESVGQIALSLAGYKDMVTQSKSSMESLQTILVNIQKNLSRIMIGTAVVASLFLLWLLIAQIVIFSQGWELYQGTAGRMESSAKINTLADKPDSANVDNSEPPVAI